MLAHTLKQLPFESGWFCVDNSIIIGSQIKDWSDIKDGQHITFFPQTAFHTDVYSQHQRTLIAEFRQPILEIANSKDTRNPGMHGLVSHQTPEPQPPQNDSSWGSGSRIQVESLERKYDYKDFSKTWNSSNKPLPFYIILSVLTNACPSPASQVFHLNISLDDASYTVIAAHFQKPETSHPVPNHNQPFPSPWHEPVHRASIHPDTLWKYQNATRRPTSPLSPPQCVTTQTRQPHPHPCQNAISIIRPDVSQCHSFIHNHKLLWKSWSWFRSLVRYIHVSSNPVKLGFESPNGSTFDPCL